MLACKASLFASVSQTQLISCPCDGSSPIYLWCTRGTLHSRGQKIIPILAIAIDNYVQLEMLLFRRKIECIVLGLTEISCSTLYIYGVLVNCLFFMKAKCELILVVITSASWFYEDDMICEFTLICFCLLLYVQLHICLTYSRPLSATCGGHRLGVDVLWALWLLLSDDLQLVFHHPVSRALPEASLETCKPTYSSLCPASGCQAHPRGGGSWHRWRWWWCWGIACGYRAEGGRWGLRRRPVHRGGSPALLWS